MNIRKKLIGVFSGCAILSGAVSCVNIDYILGSDIIADSERFVTETVTIPLDSIEMRPLDKMSGYSSLRLSIGAIRDEVDGVERITRRASAVTLIPLKDTIDWGQNPELVSFFFSVPRDSVSLADKGQRNIIQNFKVYDINSLYPYDPANPKPFDSLFVYTNDIRTKDFKGLETISKGTTIYNGGSMLEFYFKDDFAKSYMGVGKEPVDSISRYTAKHHGIFICCDDPVNQGGRLNFFNVSLDVDRSTGQISNSYAELQYKACFNGETTPRDTSAIFALGAVNFDANEYYAFNTCEEEYDGARPSGRAKESVFIEGGTGIKPMIRAEWLRKAVLKELESRFGAKTEELAAKERIIINRATLILPFEPVAEYENWAVFPNYLNPTLRIEDKDKGTVLYGGLTDASVSDENQGDINRSLSSFRPDITHHMQQILSTSKDSLSRLENENIWFLILASETYKTVSNSNSQSDYYNQMAYLNYYNSMYGGYGGYGGYGYGGYGGYGYNNYYNYYAMQAYYDSMNNSSNNSTTTTTMLDKDRYYNCKLNGPEAAGQKPRIQITFSYMRDSK